MQLADEQADVIAFLRCPENWAGTATCVDVIETHGARVFMAGDTALKVKRAVRLPYLDFSTLDARRRASQREIEVNRPHAPGIYQDVVAITRDTGGQLAINGKGSPVEWAVRMVRFPQNHLLSHIAETDGISRELAVTLADMAWSYHRAAPQLHEVTETLAETARTVLTQIRDNSDDQLAEAAQAFEADLVPALQRSSAVRQRRAKWGCVRRCHGDLHLGNIVMWDGYPVAFDAIEFDEALATIDTLYDLAFLLMDLERRKARAAANVVLNRYLWRSGDPLDLEGLAALPFYLGLRAAIRAMAALDRARAGAGPDVGLTAHARDTLVFARRLLTPPPARLVIVGGLSGTGKSTLAAAIAPGIGASPGAVHLRTDLERKWLAGVGELDRLPPSSYTQASSVAVYRRVMDRTAAALAAGHSVIADGVFARPEERADMKALATAVGVAFDALWLEAPPGVLRSRVAARTADASDATTAVVDQQLQFETGPINWAKIDTSGGSEQVQASALAALRLTP